ncbi:MAG TPA: sigma-70 family RNA polymerase sigma factor [Bryobacteraceae bacterium]|nr:sigma-70 family RNA polymerase sigma factor [Bryobacteraceae bacterium]
MAQAETMVLEETDRELVEACQRGESDAFRALFERYKDKVYSIALRYSGDAASAEDIAQESFLKLFVGIGGFRGESSFSAWLYRLVVNSCLDQKRRAWRLTPLLDDALDLLRSPGQNALDGMMHEEISAHLRSVLAGLSDEQRMLVVLRYTQSLSYDEIAEILGTSTGTIASRLNRIHRTLERRLSRFAGKGGRRG